MTTKQPAIYIINETRAVLWLRKVRSLLGWATNGSLHMGGLIIFIQIMSSGSILKYSDIYHIYTNSKQMKNVYFLACCFIF